MDSSAWAEERAQKGHCVWDLVMKGKASAIPLATAPRAPWVALEGSWCWKREWMAEVSRLGGNHEVKDGYMLAIFLQKYRHG